MLDVDPDQEENETEGANVDLDGQVKGKCAVIKTSTRQVKKLTYKAIQFKLTVTIDYLPAANRFS